MKKYTYLFALLAGLCLFACGEDEPPAVPAPTANFTFDINGKTVSFTDSSTEAESYSWDFGDGNTSTEASPTHTYSGNGGYVITLTVTNSSGDASKQATIEIINVAIDGSFDDWDDVPSASTSFTGTLRDIKIENLGNVKLFIYVEGTEDMTDLAQLYLNTDNNVATGALITWLYANGGEDIVIEGNLPSGDEQYASIYECSPCDGSAPDQWNWAGAPSNEDISSFAEASAMTSIPGGKAFEIAIDLTALPTTVSSDAIGVGFADTDITTWGPQGSTPSFIEETLNPAGDMILYTFK